MKITIQWPEVDPRDPFAAMEPADVLVLFDDGHTVGFKARTKSVLNMDPEILSASEEVDFSAPAVRMAAREGGHFSITFDHVETLEFGQPPARTEEGHGTAPEAP